MKVDILNLKPTQFSVGFKDVDDKIAKILAKHHKEQDKKVPVIVGPKKQLYMIDHHHFVRAMWEVGEKRVHVEVVANYSRLSVKKFWSKMRTMKYVFLFDQLGCGPHKPHQLPTTIRSMSDNPYRSLAWMVREAGGFSKSVKPFAEFYWAEYFRTNMGIIDPLSKKGLHVALGLCHDKKALKLPGYKR